MTTEPDSACRRGRLDRAHYVLSTELLRETESIANVALKPRHLHERHGDCACTL